MNTILDTFLKVPEQAEAEGVIYPESDGQPMGETDTHRTIMIDLILVLQDRYRDDPNVYVSGDLFVYYEQGNPAAVFAPDAFVVFGVPKKLRRIYKLWEEGFKTPDVVIEVTSRGTRREDTGTKMDVCRRLGVSEYFLYDPYGEYLDPPLQGYRLAGKKYVPIIADVTGQALASQVLDVRLQAEGETLRLIDARSGEALLTPLEAQAARREEAAARREEAAARREAERRAAAAEAEIIRLRAELEGPRQQDR